MKIQLKIVLAVVVCVVGVGVGVRAVYRPAEKRVVAEPVVESPERLEAIELMGEIEPRLRVPTSAEVPGVLDEIRQRTVASGRLLAGESRLDNVQARDLGLAFVERVGFVLGGDFDVNASALAARGWPLPDREVMVKKRANWEKFYRDRALPALLADGVEVRAISAEMMELRGGLGRAGFGLSVFVPGTNGDPGYFEYEGQDLVEVSVPMQIKDVAGRPAVVLTAFLFAWDVRNSRWRPIQSLVHCADEEAGGLATPHIF